MMPERIIFCEWKTFSFYCVTGKAFFRECRLQLKPPVFDAFLEVVKQLNRNEISREQAVEKSKEVLGADNMELVGSFRTLLFG